MAVSLHYAKPTMRREEKRPRVAYALARVGLQSREGQTAGGLSGGEVISLLMTQAEQGTGLLPARHNLALASKCAKQIEMPAGRLV